MTVVPATEDNIARAAQALRAGEAVAFPTETVYGLGADATQGEAVARIFEIKGRPRFNPLIVHVTGLEAARRHARFTPLALKLARAFWPGALTLVLDKTEESGLSDLVSAGLGTVALRVPGHKVAQRLLTQAGLPVAAPSANRSGHVSPTTAQHVQDDLGDAALILDGGATPGGLESTVVDARGRAPVLLRLGGVTRDQIERVAGAALRQTEDSAAPLSPGQLESHYAPRARLRLEAEDVRPGEALLAFGSPAPAGAVATINLSPAGDMREAAAALFKALRDLDASGAGTIAVMKVPEHGLGEAINDRLRRAAAPRLEPDRL